MHPYTPLPHPLPKKHTLQHTLLLGERHTKGVFMCVWGGGWGMFEMKYIGNELVRLFARSTTKSL